MSTPDSIDRLKQYKRLPAKDRSAVLMAVSKLEQIRVSGNPPSPEVVLECLTATGHLDIAMAIYGAQLTKQQF